MNRVRSESRAAELKTVTKTSLVLAGLALVASGCSSGDSTPPSQNGTAKHTASAPPASPSSFNAPDNCKTFIVYSQNRWAPYGTAVREAPSATSKLVGTFGTTDNTRNQVIPVDGYVHTGLSTYKNNVAPFNNDVWYHLKFALKAGQDEWVSFPGVRGDPTSEDPTGQSADGGTPAPLDPNCVGTYLPSPSHAL